MEPLRYHDLDLKIDREGEGFVANVIKSPAGESSSTFVLPFSDVQLENLILKLGNPRQRTRNVNVDDRGASAAREFGRGLFEAVFSGEVLACLRSSMNQMRREEGTGLRLKLRLQETPELADLPWELLLDPFFQTFMAQSNQTPVVRYIEMPEDIRPLTVKLPLQVLVMISSPSDFAHLDVQREKMLLENALGGLVKEGKVRVTWLENATLQELQNCLMRGQYHVFHFIGHGGFDTKSLEGLLVLEQQDGHSLLANAHRIGTVLHDHRSLRLAVLNSCEGARNSRTDLFAGVATSLIRHGIPAVVAMQFEITDEAAIAFASQFYAALAYGYPVDAAVAEARKAVYALPNDIEWATPVLYMRSPDGVLFSLDRKPESYPSSPPAAEPVSQPPPDARAAGSVAQLPPVSKVGGPVAQLPPVSKVGGPVAPPLSGSKTGKPERTPEMAAAGAKPKQSSTLVWIVVITLALLSCLGMAMCALLSSSY